MLMKEGLDYKYGARHLKRAVERFLVYPLSNLVATGQIGLGDLVHVDVKKIGRIPPGGGWRAHGRAAGDTAAHKKAKTGFDYVHSAVDDHSRLAYSELLPDEKGPTCGAFIVRALAFFAAHGVTVTEVMTDNHMSYKLSNDVRNALADAGIRHVFIRPHCPWQNGKVERFNRTLQAEWAYRRVFVSNQARARAFDRWLDDYNNRRRHTALGGLPPISRITVSPT